MLSTDERSKPLTNRNFCGIIVVRSKGSEKGMTVLEFVRDEGGELGGYRVLSRLISTRLGEGH